MELIEALAVIRQECKNHDECRECPFKDANKNCYIQNKVPEKWKIITDMDDEVISLFK